MIAEHARRASKPSKNDFVFAHDRLPARYRVSGTRTASGSIRKPGGRTRIRKRSKAIAKGCIWPACWWRGCTPTKFSSRTAASTERKSRKRLRRSLHDSTNVRKTGGGGVREDQFEDRRRHDRRADLQFSRPSSRRLHRGDEGDRPGRSGAVQRPHRAERHGRAGRVAQESAAR